MSTLANLKLNLTTLESSAGIQWKEQLLDYDTDGNLVYKGVHLRENASQGDPDSFIWRFSWTSGNLTRIHGPVVKSWTERTSI